MRLSNPYIRAFLRGAALPGMIVAACAAVGFIMDVFREEPILRTISGFKAGIMLGLFISLWGVLEMIGFILTTSDIPWKFRWVRVLGYVTIWVVCILIIFKLA